MDGRKVCVKCGVGKSLDEFYRHSMTRDRRHQCCKQCHNSRSYEAKKSKGDQYRARRSAYDKQPHVRERLALYQRIWKARRNRKRLGGTE